MTTIGGGTYPVSRLVTYGIASSAHLSWRFERGADALLLETHMDRTTHEYVLVSVQTGHAKVTERFTRYPEYIARVLALDHTLAQQRWTQTQVQADFSIKKPSRRRSANASRSDCSDGLDAA